jgi:hypothetical protein
VTDRKDPAPAFDTSVPHIARVYDYWLGGKDNFAADRKAGDWAREAYPQITLGVRANRAYLARVVQFLAGEAGIRQFLDIGTGIPAANNTYQVAQAVAPDARVVYADNDPIVLSHPASDLGGSTRGEMHRRLNELMPMQVRPRSLEEVTGFFDGTDPVPPGVVRIAQWRPESELESRSPAAVWGGVGRKAE